MQVEKVKKSSQTIAIFPKTGNMTLINRKIYNVLLKYTHDELIRRGISEEDGQDLSFITFSAPLSKVLAQITSEDSKSDLSSTAKSFFKRMIGTIVEFEAPDAKNSVVWEAFGLLSYAKIENSTGEKVVHWRLQNHIARSVLVSSNYVMLSLEEMAKLSSYASLALYELCSRYRKLDATSTQSTGWWHDALTASAMKEKRNKHGVMEITRRSWPKFKNDTIKPAIKEINEKTDLEIDLKDFKVGRVIVDARFLIKRKGNVPSDGVIENPLIAAEIYSQADSLGVASAAKRAFEKEGIPEDVIQLALKKFQTQFDMTEKDGAKKIDNPAAYFNEVLNDVKGKVRSASNPTPNLKVVGVAEATLVAPATLSASMMEFASLKEEFLLLDRASQQPFIETVLATTTIPLFRRKLLDDELTSPPVLNLLIHAYRDSKAASSGVPIEASVTT